MNNVISKKTTKLVAATGLALTLAFTTVAAGAGASTVDAAQTTHYTAKPQMVTAKSAVKVRASESTGSKVLGTLKKGEKVYFIKDDYGWSKVTYKGKTGYVGTRYLNIPGKQVNSVKAAPTKKAVQPKVVTPVKKATTKAPVVAKATTKTVTANTAVHVRADQSRTSKILGTLKKGEKVTFVQENKGWSKVIYKGKTGYVVTEFLNVK
ncbi:SH3 domain-containing protein [Listeria grandensis]|uniref:SH3 domain-containing protein n=1 Tax=Listeria grandensis TaxID=1494963 RepID=UPI00164CECB4|nr:SH3 domain-containing protein [Listeria grandensis]MBC6316816.1 SH3 domain-containing protein [Listeria grandensis]